MRFPLTNLSAGLARSEAERGFIELTCELLEVGLTGRSYQITGTIEVVDSFGNVSTAEGVEMILSAAAASRINCDNQGDVVLANIADRWDVHPALR
jgi:hypothetical protein